MAEPSSGPPDFSDEQKSAIQEIVRVLDKMYDGKVKILDENGRLLGPFAIMIHTPSTILPYIGHATVANTTPLLTPRERELAALVTTSVTGADFVAYAHKKIALTFGITEVQADTALKGEIPEQLEDREAVVTRLALECAVTIGKLSKETWEKGEDTLGTEAMSALVQYVAHYLHAGTVVNAAYHIR